MHGGAPAHLTVLNASFECSLRFSTTPRRGLQMPTIPRRARPGAQLRTSARMAPAKGGGRVGHPGTPSRAGEGTDARSSQAILKLLGPLSRWRRLLALE